jgi:hypothetical protein
LIHGHEQIPRLPPSTGEQELIDQRGKTIRLDLPAHLGHRPAMVRPTARGGERPDKRGHGHRAWRDRP